LDCTAIHEWVLPGALLMQRAGFSLFKRIPKDAKHIIIFAGSGNNGGDGFVVAALAKQAGLTVSVQLMANSDYYIDNAKIMLDHAKTLGVEFKLYSKTYVVSFSVDVIIGAIFGTGLS